MNHDKAATPNEAAATHGLIAQPTAMRASEMQTILHDEKKWDDIVWAVDQSPVQSDANAKF